MPPLHSGEFFICIHDLDPGVKPQDDTTSLKLRGAGTTVLCSLFLSTVVIPATAGVGPYSARGAGGNKAMR